jgi:hypothetical protein
MNFGGIILAVALWSSWKTRNHIIFQRYDTLSLNALYFSIFSLLSGINGAMTTPFRTADQMRRAGNVGQQGGSVSTNMRQAAVVSSDEDLLE